MMTMEHAMGTLTFDRNAPPSVPPVASRNAKPAIATLPAPNDPGNVARSDQEDERPTLVARQQQQQQTMMATATQPPPLDLQSLERKDSTSTTSSSSSHLEDGDGSSSSDDDDGNIAYGHDDDAALENYLVKPMSRLPVCPFDDLAVEEEKRRRRTVRMMKNDKNNRVHCPDAESLPSPTSKRVPSQRRFTANQIASGSDVARTNQLSAPTLRRDSMAIRQQYWKQLGLSMSRRDLERNTSTGQRKPRHVGVKVQLNDANADKGESKSIFQIISSWYTSEEKESTSASKDKDTTGTAPSETDSESSTASSSSLRRKSIRFCEEAEMFYIPLHKDYSKRQRDCMWHTRREFVSMVERNLDDVYEEMEREYEEQVQAEMAENDAMAKEEASQRAYEAQMRAKEADRKAKAAKAAAAAAVALSSPPFPGTPQMRTPMGSPGTSPPMLALCPLATQIKVAPRARSPHDIRFKYLKHLGINNK